MDFQTKRLAELNRLYTEHESSIDSLQAGLRRELPLLVQEFKLSLDQTEALDDYVNDRATIFRFLRKNNFSLPHTLSLLVDTLKWRIRESVDNLKLSDIDPCFFKEPFCFFHKTDRWCRPVLIIQLRHLPSALDEASDKITFLSSFTMFVLETIRKITWEATQERMNNGVENPVVTDTLVLVDFKNAKSLPRDTGLMQAFIKLVRRYPLSAGTVCLLNFGWMYQGLWQMVKLLLTEEAKNRVCFPKVKELGTWVDQEDLLADFESGKAVSWDLSQDTVYNQSVPSSPILSRRNSTSTVYFDSYDSLSRSPSTTHLARFPYQRRLSTASSCYATPIGGMTPIPSHTNLVGLTKTPRIRSALRSFLDPNDGASSWILSEKLNALERQQRAESTTTSGEPSRRRRERRRDMAAGLVLRMLVRAEHLVRLMVVRCLKKAVRYRNTMYWIAACVLLRDGVQEFLQHLLSLVGELLVERLSLGVQDASAAGMRSLFSLTTGHRGQLTL
ncbi:hypothetical protein BJV82DRAFT_506700 [Fennellomyces sp. T-0311]|nr:hypothetical protein BJV82DRAFT_506700 [Fennellomyces sp. T-0311]